MGSNLSTPAASRASPAPDAAAALAEIVKSIMVEVDDVVAECLTMGPVSPRRMPHVAPRAAAAVLGEIEKGLRMGPGARMVLLMTLGERDNYKARGGDIGAPGDNGGTGGEGTSQGVREPVRSLSASSHGSLSRSNTIRGGRGRGPPQRHARRHSLAPNFTTGWEPESYSYSNPSTSSNVRDTPDRAPRYPQAERFQYAPLYETNDPGPARTGTQSLVLTPPLTPPKPPPPPPRAPPPLSTLDLSRALIRDIVDDVILAVGGLPLSVLRAGAAEDEAAMLAAADRVGERILEVVYGRCAR